MEIPAVRYLRAAEEHGSPAYTEEELIERSWPERQQVDKMFAEFMGIELRPSTGKAMGSCHLVPPKAPGGGVRVGPGKFTLANTGHTAAVLALGRFADGLPVELGPVSAGSARSLSIPPDRSDRSWRIAATGGPVVLCGLRS